MQDPVGLQGTKIFLGLPFPDYKKQDSFSTYDPLLSSKEQIQTVANQGREGMQRTLMQPWDRVLIPLQGIHRIFEMFCRHWHPQRVGKVNCLLPTSTQTPNWLKPDWWCWLPLISPPTHQKNWSHPLWTTTIKLLTTPSWLGHIVFRALAHCVPVCLAKQ